RELFVEVDRALDRLLPVEEVKALVLRVRVGVRILDADEERGHAAELARERLDERDRAAAAHRDPFDAVALLERTERRLERGMRRIGVPPAVGSLGVDLDLDAPRRRLLELLDELLLHPLGLQVGHDADADARPRALINDVARVLAVGGGER